MGFFGKLFGREEELRQLDASSPAAARIGRFQSEMETFVNKMNDRLEFVPADEAVYCFIGKPPAMFGMAWFHHGKEHNLKTLAKDKGLSTKKLQNMSLQLGEAYQRYMNEPRFCITISGKKVIVHPSDGLRKDVVEIIHVLD